MPSTIKIKLSKFLRNQRLAGTLLLIFILLPAVLTACSKSQATPTISLLFTPLASTTAQVDAAPTSTSAAVVASPTQANFTATAIPTLSATATTAPTAQAAASFTPTLHPTQSAAAEPTFWVNMAADIQNNVNGVLQVLNIDGTNGTANITILTSYSTAIQQYNSSYNTIQYLATYFKGMNSQAIAQYFGGKVFSVYIKTISIGEEYIVETTTSYELMNQIGQNLVKQGDWEAAVNAQVVMDYKVLPLCDVTPNPIAAANTDQPITIDAWLIHGNKPVAIRYMTAAWQDSNGIQYYCAGGRNDSSCKGHSGNVKSGDTLTVDVNIESTVGSSYTCQVTYTAP